MSSRTCPTSWTHQEMTESLHEYQEREAAEGRMEERREKETRFTPQEEQNMTGYRIESMDSTGQEKTWLVDAETSEGALAEVRLAGYFPTRIDKIADVLGVPPLTPKQASMWSKLWELVWPS